MKTITLPPTTGKELIFNNPLFSWTDFDFENYGLNHEEKPTKETEVRIVDLEKDGTFMQIFERIGEKDFGDAQEIDLDKYVLTQSQIIEFSKTLKKNDKYDYFFLMKKDCDFFVADVGFDDGGQLGVGVRRLSYGSVWSAGDRRRLVVPQLDPRTLESSHSESSALDSFISDLELLIRKYKK